MKDKLYFIVICTLASVILAVILVLLYGLFDQRVDNDKVFAILGPAFQTIVGCFVGVLAGRLLNQQPPTDPPSTTP